MVDLSIAVATVAMCSFAVFDNDGGKGLKKYTKAHLSFASLPSRMLIWRVYPRINTHARFCLQNQSKVQDCTAEPKDAAHFKIKTLK